MRETITAIATPAGEGGIGVIRISGKETLAITSSLFQPANGKPVTELESQRVYFGKVIQPSTQQVIDEGLLTIFRAPKSYTCEDVVEISVHGGALVTNTVLQAALDQGARLAEPGEFTRRAFLNGRFDLTQAEAVADLIHASSEKALASALNQLRGRLSEKLNSMYDRLLGVLAQLEAAIDFPEEGLKFQEREKTLSILKETQSEADQLAQSFREGKIVREGANVTLVGKPNVGKSSLLNALLQEDRAIVTPYPGTTRDALEEKVKIKDIHINIIDTAGLRAHPETIEKEGIARTRVSLSRSDLALIIFDHSQPLDSNDDLLISEVEDKPQLVILNKSDLKPAFDSAQLNKKLPGANPIRISAKTHEGMDDLVEAIHQLVLKGRTEEPLVITRERHRGLLVEARDALSNAGESLQQKLSEELVAVDVNIALDRIGNILGKTFEEDLLDQIFNEFCIGK